MTVSRSDGGEVMDVSAIGPAGYVYLPAGFPAQEIYAGHALLRGYSWENSGSADNSTTAEGNVTGPAAGATIASVTLGQGTWLIGWTIGYGAGAVAAVEQDNMQLTGLPGGAVTGIIPAVANQQVIQQTVEFTGSGTIAVKAIALATATAVYEAELVATPVAAGFARIYDGSATPQLQVATSYLPAPSFDTQAVGDGGIEMKRGIYVAATSLSIAGTIHFIPLQDS